tara:strand:- start:1250 stop:2008 length:759 start_codon:yes stop_codon:yes gene_type:complete
MKITQSQLEPIIKALAPFTNLKVAEIAVQVAQALGQPTVEACGAYKSGKLVLPAQVTNTLNGLAPTGVVVKVGHGRWSKGTTEQIAPTVEPTEESIKMVVAPTVEPTEVEVDLMEMIEIAEQVDQADLIYDLNDAMTLDFFIANTACFSKFAKSDKGCKACLLKAHCAQAKAGLKEERASAKKAEAQAKAVKEEAGIKVDLPDGVDISTARKLNASGSAVCVATGEAIAEGEPMWFVPRFGVLSNKAYHAIC